MTIPNYESNRSWRLMLIAFIHWGSYITDKPFNKKDINNVFFFCHQQQLIGYLTDTNCIKCKLNFSVVGVRPPVCGILFPGVFVKSQIVGLT